jgi:hypothetical protein
MENLATGFYGFYECQPSMLSALNEMENGKKSILELWQLAMFGAFSHGKILATGFYGFYRHQPAMFWAPNKREKD